ncbi:nucleolar MIF4G domain-containing protein 1-like [Saccoglossus kowalevskii]
MEAHKMANEEEDATIQYLEKKLKLNKKKLQAVFRNDGLDDLLEFCDSENRGTLLDIGDGDMFREESESDEEITEMPPKVLNAKSKTKVEQINDERDEEQHEDDDDNDVDDDHDDEEEEDEEEEENREHGDEFSSSEADSGQREDEDTVIDLPESKKETEKNTIKRKKVIHDEELHLKKKQKQKIETDEELVDEVKSVSKYENEIKQNVKETTRKRKRKGQVKYDIYGRPIGGSNEETGVYVPPQQRARMMGKDEDSQKLDRLRRQIKGLLNRLIIHCVLIYDIIRKLIERFTEGDIELLLLLLKNVGLTLRRDDPLSLKDVILQIQRKAVDAKDKFKDQARVKFMLDTIGALKNNNLRKIPNYDPSHLEHLKKLLRAFTKDHSSSDCQLRISLSDLLSAEEKGRWWVVGSAWVGQQSTEQQTENKPTIEVHNKVSSKIMDLSRKQRMNTDTRRNIFCAIVTSEDFVDAFDKLLHLNLKDRQEREIVYVLLDCCLQEKPFNPYYGYLASKFCLYDRRFQIAFQFAFWDKFKVIDKLSTEQLTNLAKLLVHLLVSKSLALSVLKVIDFAELNKPMMVWLRQSLMELLLENPKDVSIDVFARIAPYPKLHSLRDGLRLFMRQFLLRNQQKSAESTREQLKLMVQMADGALQGHDSSMML